MSTVFKTDITTKFATFFETIIQAYKATKSSTIDSADITTNQATD